MEELSIEKGFVPSESAYTSPKLSFIRLKGKVNRAGLNNCFQ